MLRLIDLENDSDATCLRGEAFHLKGRQDVQIVVLLRCWRLLVAHDDAARGLVSKASL